MTASGPAKTASVIRWWVKGNSIFRSGAFGGVRGRRGKIHIPRQRSPDCSRRTRLRHWAKICDSVNWMIAGRFFFRGSRAGCSARQNRRTGHSPQRGRRGRQSSAPRSIKAELWTRAWLAGRSAVAVCQRCLRPPAVSIGICKFVRRATTRPMLASMIGSAGRRQNWQLRPPCSGRRRAAPRS